MQSKTSFFSRTIFFNQLKRFWPLYGAYFATGLLLFILPFASTLRYDFNAGTLDPMYAAMWIMNVGLYGGSVIPIIFSAFFAMAAFNYLYNNRSVSQMSCLPIKREGVFLSAYLPGLLVMLVSNLVICLLSLAITSFYGLSLAGYVFQAFAMMSLMTLFFYSFASFVAMLTGQILVLPLVYGVLNVTVAGVVMLVYTILEKFLYGMALSSMDNSFLLKLSPIVYILGITNTNTMYGIDMSVLGYAYNSWGYLIAIAIAGLVFTGLAIVLLKRRRMETAGDVVAINPLKPVFKYCMAFGSALVAGVGLYFLVFEGRLYREGAGLEDAVIMLLFMLTGAFIGYFTSEMMMQKSFKVFGGKSWRGFAAVALILLVLTAASEFDLLGFERRVPEASEVESVSVYGFGDSNTLTDKSDIQEVIDIHKSLVEHKVLHESTSSSGYNPSFYIDYFMKDGNMLRRRYSINTDVVQDIDAIADFLNKPEMILERVTPNIENLSAKHISEGYVNMFSEEYGYYTNAPLTSEDAFELYTECILPDIMDGTLGFIDLGWIGRDYGAARMNCDIALYFFQRDGNDDYVGAGSYIFTPTDKSLRTNAWLAEHGFEIEPYDEPVYYQ